MRSSMEVINLSSQGKLSAKNCCLLDFRSIDEALSDFTGFVGEKLILSSGGGLLLGRILDGKQPA